MVEPTKQRELNRLKYYDYAQTGVYFVTICVNGKDEVFGQIKNNQMYLNDCGNAVKKCWMQIPDHFPHTKLDEYIIMPNHVHGIVVIENNFQANNNVRNKFFCSLQWQTKLSRSLSSIIRGFKIGVTKWARQNGLDNFKWQKSFYDHIVRNEKSLHEIHDYIRTNPLKWELDKNEPFLLGKFQ